MVPSGEPGDIIVFEQKGRDSGHVGMVTSVTTTAEPSQYLSSLSDGSHCGVAITPLSWSHWKKRQAVIGRFNYLAESASRAATPLRLVTVSQGVPVHSVGNDPALYFTAGMTIDADGSPHAYHPKDAEGMTRWGSTIWPTLGSRETGGDSRPSMASPSSRAHRTRLQASTSRRRPSKIPVKPWVTPSAMSTRSTFLSSYYRPRCLNPTHPMG